VGNGSRMVGQLDEVGCCMMGGCCMVRQLDGAVPLPMLPLPNQCGQGNACMRVRLRLKVAHWLAICVGMICHA